MKYKTRRNIIIKTLYFIIIILFSPLIVFLLISKLIAEPILDLLDDQLVKIDNYLIKIYPSKE